MPACRILQLGDPLLWQMSAEVTDFDSPRLKSIISDLDDTLAEFRRTHGFGRGIAAPQIGELSRVIFVRMPDGSFDGPMINPTIIRQSAQRKELWDNCFSFPDLVVKVSRAIDITVAYQDTSGRPVTIDVSGDFSELLQHEIDHLDGILATDRAVSAHAIMTRDEWIRQGSLK